MKIKLIASILLLLINTGTYAAEVYNKNANKLDLYGKVTGMRYFSSNDDNNGDQTVARLGFKGETQINNALTGFGQWEANMGASKDESSNNSQIKTRLAFAGLKYLNLGSLDFGRNRGVGYDIESFTDVLPEFGGGTWTQTDVYMTSRASNLLTYRNTDFFALVDGLNFALQYQGANKTGRSSLSKQNGEGYGVSLSYENSGISIGSGFTHSKRTQDQINAGSDLNASGDTAEAWISGIKYDDGSVYLAGTYSQTQNMTRYGTHSIANKVENMELVAQYVFDSGLSPSLAYLKSEGKDLGSWGNQDLVEYIEVGGVYNLNKNLTTYVDYKINLLKESPFTKAVGISTDNIVATGIVYRF